MESVDKIVEYMVHLENLLVLRDEYLSTRDLFASKADLFREHSTQETLLPIIEECETTVFEADALAQGAAQAVVDFSNTKSVEAGRLQLTQLKTVLNHYMALEATNFEEKTLDILDTPEGVLTIGLGLIGEKTSE